MIHLKTVALKHFLASYHEVWSKVSWILTKTYPTSKKTPGKWRLLLFKDITQAVRCQYEVMVWFYEVWYIHSTYRYCWRHSTPSCLVERAGYFLVEQIIAVYFLSNNLMSSFFKRYMENSIPKTVWKQGVSKFTNPAKLCGGEKTSRQVPGILSASFARPHCVGLQVWQQGDFVPYFRKQVNEALLLLQQEFTEWKHFHLKKKNCFPTEPIKWICLSRPNNK